MPNYSLSHVRDDVLLQDLAALTSQDRVTTASMLAHIGEVDARRLYAPGGYSCMHAYCVGELRLSEDAASRRIQAARAARRFPVLFPALAEGRLHLTAVNLLAPYLTDANAVELIDLATHRRKSEIEEILVRRFGPSDVTIASLRPVSVSERHESSALAHVECHTPDESAPHAAEETATDSDERLEARYLLQVTISKTTQEKLRYAQTLLSHDVPNGDMAEVLDRALDQLIVQLEKRKAGASATRAPRLGRSERVRHIPMDVKHAVWKRDGRQCTFVSSRGVRCGARKFLEFDHVDPVAFGGAATIAGIRLRCRAHNQFEAERVFGAAFMARKRAKSKIEAAERRSAEVASAPAEDAEANQHEQTQDLVAALRTLGLRREEAIRAAEITASIHAATLEDRVRAALGFLGKRSALRRVATVIPSPMGT